MLNEIKTLNLSRCYEIKTLYGFENVDNIILNESMKNVKGVKSLKNIKWLKNESSTFEI